MMQRTNGLTAVVVERVDPPTGPKAANQPSTLMLVTGREVGTPRRVQFAVERREAEAMALALTDAEAEVVCMIEPWQIIGGGLN